MRVLAVLICAALVSLTMFSLSRFAAYTGRRAAQAEAPGEFFTPAGNRWLLILLGAGWVGMMVCLVLCIVVLRVVGGFEP